MGTLTYSHNNSGGHWWLSDSDWEALAENGWKVDWYADREDSIFGAHEDGRFLGALASGAEIDTDDPEKTIADWERITGENALSLGCNCCGAPHSFTYEGEKGDTRWFYPTADTGSW